MVNKIVALNKMRDFIIMQLDNVARTSPMIAFTKPILKRIVNNNYQKLSGILDLVADSDGNIDFDSLLSEMTTSLLNTNKFAYHTDTMGDIYIGGGEIRLCIPLIGKELVFNTEDFNSLGQMLKSI